MCKMSSLIKTGTVTTEHKVPCNYSLCIVHRQYALLWQSNFGVELLYKNIISEKSCGAVGGELARNTLNTLVHDNRLVYFRSAYIRTCMPASRTALTFLSKF